MVDLTARESERMRVEEIAHTYLEKGFDFLIATPRQSIT